MEEEGEWGVLGRRIGLVGKDNWGKLGGEWVR